MKRINVGELIAGLGVSVITFTGITTIYHFSNGAVFSNTGTTSTSVISNTPPTSATPITIFGGPLGGLGGSGNISGGSVVGSGGGSVVGSGGGSVSCINSSSTYDYDGKYGWDGSPQYFTITPSISACGSISFTLYGGGGGASAYETGAIGGSGGLTTGIIPTNAISSNTLTIIVAGGGQHDSGGGGSFVCLGTQCSMSTVLLAAGGGGGANAEYNGGDGGGGNQNGQNGITYTGVGPNGGPYAYPAQGGTLTAGGMGGYDWESQPFPYNLGIGGAGGAAGEYGGGQGTPFGTGGIDPNGNNDNGGYGGGGSGAGGAEGAAGGGGYYGGGGMNTEVIWGSGAGGSGYCAPIVQNCGGKTGGANNGGVYHAHGGPGKVIISW